MQAAIGWIVIHCHILEAADEAITRAGYTTYLPHYKVRLSGVRIAADGRRVRTRGPGSIVHRPLFPAYLFVAWHDGLRERPLLVAAGRRCAILRYPVGAAGDGGAPKVLSVGLVAELRNRVDGGDFDRIGPRPAASKLPVRVDIKPGDLVRAAGAVGELVRLDENGRAELLQRWLGSARRVTVDARDLVAAQ